MGIIEFICGLAYIANIVKLFTREFSLLRVAGIIFPPLGVILGFF